ncbi:MAG: hypothetical protein ABIO16_05200 [Nocardioides sp.]
MNDLDDELSRTLRGRADTFPHTPLAFDDVRGKAVSIRRRRRIASGLGVAAAIAVIVPTAMIATKGTNSDGPLPVTQPTTVSDTADPTPTSTPVMGKPHALDVRDLPTGAPPQIAYVDDAAATNTRAYVVVGTDTVKQIGETVAITRDDGTTLGPFPASTLARNADATAAAWVDLDGQVMLWRPGAQKPVALGSSGLQGALIQALTGDCSDGGQCSAWVSGGKGSEAVSTSVRVDQDGTVRPADPSDTVLLVKDVSPSGQLIGVSERNDYNSCSSLVSSATQWKTCKHTLDAFSPSGAYVAASDPFHSGNLNGNIAIYDAASGKATTYRIANAGDSAYYSYFAWEDDSHLLFAANQDGKWSIVRMGVDGSMEFAVPPAELGDELSNPFMFEGNNTPL